MAPILVSCFLALCLLQTRAVVGAPASEETPVEVPSDANSTATPVRTHENPCIRQGGICLLATECPEGQLAKTSGLCPEQQAAGVECCHGLSVKERRCSARGGVCRPKQKCGRNLWDNRGVCATGETCCILVS